MNMIVGFDNIRFSIEGNLIEVTAPKSLSVKEATEFTQKLEKYFKGFNIVWNTLPDEDYVGLGEGIY